MPPSKPIVRALYPAVAAILFSATANAQVLVVNDNDNITYNSDTLLNDLTEAGIIYDVYDIPTTGTPPTGTLMDGYDQVIWYCSTDGVNLGFWDPATQTNLTDRILSGKKTWIIGQDLLFALYGAAPVSFMVGDFPADFMGIASYDVQSYGDDGNTGCPGMVVDPGVAGSFSPAFNWTFATSWWVDGVTPGTDATPIYAMGPAPYVFGRRHLHGASPHAGNERDVHLLRPCVDQHVRGPYLLPSGDPRVHGRVRRCSGNSASPLRAAAFTKPGQRSC